MRKNTTHSKKRATTFRKKHPSTFRKKHKSQRPRKTRRQRKVKYHGGIDRLDITVDECPICMNKFSDVINGRIAVVDTSGNVLIDENGRIMVNANGNVVSDDNGDIVIDANGQVVVDEKEYRKLICKVNPCQHIFCCRCIEKWMQHNNTCPWCRGIIESIVQIDENENIIGEFEYPFDSTPSSDNMSDSQQSWENRWDSPSNYHRYQSNIDEGL
jgi:hypothetical protein